MEGFQYKKRMNEKRSVMFEMRELNNLIGCAIYRLGAMDKAGEEIIRPLNHVQGFVIEYLYLKEGKGCSQKEIEKRLRVARSTVAVMLANMEERGLIERTVLKGDSRQKYVSLTEAGKRSHEHFTSLNMEFEEELVSDISPEEIEAFIATIDKMKKNLDNIISENNIKE